MGVFSSTRISTQPDTGKEGKSQGRGEPRGKIYQKKKKKFLLTNLAGETKRERFCNHEFVLENSPEVRI